MSSFIKKTLLVYPLPNSFVKEDQDSLKKLGIGVRSLLVRPTKKVFLFASRQLVAAIKAFFLLPFQDRLICWFSDYHSLLPLLFAKAFRIPSLIIVGGFDAVSDPENRYGIFYKKGIRQQIARWNYQLASEIWVVDASLLKGCPHAKERDGIQSGLEHWMPQIVSKVLVVPTAYDPDIWKPTQAKKPKTILTVANFTSDQVVTRKGIPQFIKMAKQCPDWQFTIVGDSKGLIRKNTRLPSNLRVLGKRNQEELISLYSEHLCYFQGSRVEGLPNVLCEAMLCECIPIGQKAFGIETAIGTTGLVFQQLTTAEISRKLLHSAEKLDGKLCRDRISMRFPKSKRETKLNQFFGIEH